MARTDAGGVTASRPSDQWVDVVDPEDEGRWKGWAAVSIPVFLCAFVVPMRGLDAVLTPLQGIPFNTAGLVGLVVLGAFVGSQWRIKAPMVTWIPFVLVAWLIAANILFHGGGETRRALNLVILLLGAAVIATGRIDMRSLTRGLAYGVPAAIAISIARLPISSYEGRLTGVLGDPNAAGFTISTLGFAALQGLENKRSRAVLLLVMVLGVALAQSRTSMFAMGIGFLWVALSRRIGRVGGAAMLVGAFYIYRWLNDVMEERGLFAEREGSDNLRERLLEIEEEMVASAGMTGHGLGSGEADLGGGVTLFFHNSYYTMQVEGGLVALLLLVVMIVSLFWMVYRLPAAHRVVWAEAAVIAGLICSFNIGFSLTHTSMAVAFGLFIAHNSRKRKELEDNPALAVRPDSPLHVDVAPRNGA